MVTKRDLVNSRGELLKLALQFHASHNLCETKPADVVSTAKTFTEFIGLEDEPSSAGSDSPDDH